MGTSNKGYPKKGTLKRACKNQETTNKATLKKGTPTHDLGASKDVAPKKRYIRKLYLQGRQIYVSPLQRCSNRSATVCSVWALRRLVNRYVPKDPAAPRGGE